VQFPDYGTVLWSTVSRNISRKAMRFQHISSQMGARVPSGEWAEVQFPDYGTKLWSPGSRNFSRKAAKHCDNSTYLTKRARALFGACAEVQFPDYVTVLWVSGSRNDSRKALRFQHLYCKESESSVWSMHRGAVS
jgi:hypothetical protein